MGPTGVAEAGEVRAREGGARSGEARPWTGGGRAGGGTRGARRSCARWGRGAPRTPSGRRCPARRGPSGSPTPRRPPHDAGRGALLVVPDQRDVDCSTPPAPPASATEAVVALTADLGPAERYRRWLAVRRGQVRVVVGTRSAAFAPVAEPGLLAVWDDGDDLHAEPRAPYPHVRDVLVLRAHAVGAALLVGGHARTAEGQLLVESGWASEIVADRATVRAAMPRVVAQGESDLQLARDPLARAARLPSAAFEAARAALAARRPVLVQTPRAGYVPWLSCAACRETARCRRCAGPLGLPGRAADPAAAARRQPTRIPPPRTQAAGAMVRPQPRRCAPARARSAVGRGASRGAVRAADPAAAAAPSCRWCGRVESAYRCGACGSRRLRAGVVGSRRTAEELGRAFPGVPVRISGGGAPVLSTCAARAEIVVATPGAEPRGGVRCRAAARRVGPARPAGPAGGRGDAAPVDGGRRPGRSAHRRRPGARHGRPGPAAGAGAGALGPGRARRRRARRPRRGRASRPRCGWPRSTRPGRAEGPPRRADGRAARRRGARPGRDRARTRRPGPTTRCASGLWCGCRGREGRALAHALHVAQAARTARKATDPVRVRMDPPDVG